MKKKVLFLTEASYLNTGYATYSRNVLEYLRSTGKYELAELSVYGPENDPRRNSLGWKNYPNMPSDEKQAAAYNSSHVNQFGAWRLERVCNDFHPDVVLSIRDFWMDFFVAGSPYRRIFKWIWMPTVDAAPQNEEWIHYFSEADAVLTYSDWAAKILKKQSGGKINYMGTASPSANSNYKPMNREEVRASLGLPNDIKIIGTVMRNQRRKLFPVLFEAFGSYLRKSGDTKTYLHCHTSYPDNGWDLAGLLHENGISSRVLFSYACNNCGTFEVCKFNDSLKWCPACGQFKSTPVNVSVGLDDASLARIYNSFDLYVQCANCEGFGLPQVEAAACGTPIACTNYSAMEDVVDKLGAYPIRVGELYKELETGCERSVPSIESLVSIFETHFSLNEKSYLELRNKTKENFDKNYSWEKTGAVWENAIDSMPSANWSAPAIIKEEREIEFPQEMHHSDFITACCEAYLLSKKSAYSHDMRGLRRDLNFGFGRPTKEGFYSADFSIFGKTQQQALNRSDVVKLFSDKAKNSNFWERVRTGSIILESESWLK